MEAELIRKALDENELLKSCGINVQETVAISLSRGRTITDWYAGKPQVGLVAKGTLSVFSRSEDGHEVLLNIQRQGDIFGISNLFLENSLETTLRGKTNSTLIFISKETLRCHLLSDMNAMQAYARFCNEKSSSCWADWKRLPRARREAVSSPTFWRRATEGRFLSRTRTPSQRASASEGPPCIGNWRIWRTCV